MQHKVLWYTKGHGLQNSEETSKDPEPDDFFEGSIFCLIFGLRAILDNVRDYS